MGSKTDAMVGALAPTMNEHSAQAVLGVTAARSGVPVERLSVGDLPALEESVRSALSCVASDASIELTIHKVRQLFLHDLDAADC